MGRDGPHGSPAMDETGFQLRFFFHLKSYYFSIGGLPGYLLLVETQQKFLVLG
jgi:hypothetical protein